MQCLRKVPPQSRTRSDSIGHSVRDPIFLGAGSASLVRECLGASRAIYVVVKNPCYQLTTSHARNLCKLFLTLSSLLVRGVCDELQMAFGRNVSNDI